MPFFNQLKSEDNKLFLEKLTEEIEHLIQETTSIFNQVGITEQEFENYVEDSNNFTPQEWENLQNHQKVLEDRLNMLKDQAVDAEKIAKKRSDMRLSQHWLPVR